MIKIFLSNKIHSQAEAVGLRVHVTTEPTDAVYRLKILFAVGVTELLAISLCFNF